MKSFFGVSKTELGTIDLASQDFLSSITENITDMISVKDARTLKYVYINKAAERVLGLTEKQVLGKNDYQIFLKEQADRPLI